VGNGLVSPLQALSRTVAWYLDACTASVQIASKNGSESQRMLLILVTTIFWCQFRSGVVMQSLLCFYTRLSYVWTGPQCLS
jgi:hypothetical protein